MKQAEFHSRVLLTETPYPRDPVIRVCFSWIGEIRAIRVCLS